MANASYRNLTPLLSRSGGLLERAEAALRCAVAADAADATAWCRLGDVQRSKGRLAAALECYRRAASLRPDDPRTSWLLAILEGGELPDAPTRGQPVPFVYKVDFLPQARCAELLALALRFRERFQVALDAQLGRDANGQPVMEKGKVALDHRRAFLLDPRITAREVRPWFEPLLRTAFAEALPRLGLPEPRPDWVGLGMSVHLGGGFYIRHRDNGGQGFRTKVLSFAYYFHRLPRRFSGGDLLLHDERAATFTRIEPQHNSIVLFPAGCVHEIAAVGGDVEDFGDARFALHGGLERKPERAGRRRAIAGVTDESNTA